MHEKLKNEQGIRWRLKLTEPYLVNQSGHTDDGRGAALVTLTTAEGPLPDRSEWFREPETPSSTLKMNRISRKTPICDV